MLELAGEWTFDSFSEHLGTLDTFPGYTPEQPVYRSYRRWGLESAALDLALRQAGKSLHEVLGRDVQPVTFVDLLAHGHAADARPRDAAPRALTRTSASSSTARPTGATS